MTPYSLYVPSAGFLWSDHLTWSQESSSFENEGSAAPCRIVMKDPVGKFTPWILQMHLGHSLNNGLEQDLLMNREPVVLRSVQSKQFLAVSNEPSLLEAYAGIENATDTGRFAVA